MKISLIIPAYNEEKYIGECLKSIQLCGGNLLEVIVINNASTDKTAEIARSFPGIRVVDEFKKGTVAARGRGFKEAKGDYVAFIDADCRLTPDWFRTIFEAFKDDPRLVSLSGPYKYYDLRGFKNFIAGAMWWLSVPITYRIVGYMILAGNFVVKKEMVIRAGGLNTDGVYFYGDDTDTARRLAPFGKVAFRMDFFVYSSARRLSGQGFLKTYFLYGINFLWEVFLGKPFTKDYQDVR